MADVYAVMQGDNTNCIVFNDDGKAVNIAYPAPQLLSQVKSAIEAHFNIELTQTSLATGVVNMNEQLPDWDTYELVS